MNIVTLYNYTPIAFIFTFINSIIRKNYSVKMGQYKKRFLEARKIKNLWNTKTRLYIEIAKIISSSKKCTLEKMVLKLRKRGYNASRSEILQYIEKLNHTLYLKLLRKLIIKYLVLDREKRGK